MNHPTPEELAEIIRKRQALRKCGLDSNKPLTSEHRLVIIDVDALLSILDAREVTTDVDLVARRMFEGAAEIQQHGVSWEDAAESCKREWKRAAQIAIRAIAPASEPANQEKADV